MENLAMCRICLTTRFRLRSVAHHLRAMYERISSLKFERNDRRPLVACYICHARLQTCYRLRMSCLESDKQLTEMTSSPVIQPRKVLSTNTFRLLSLLNFGVGYGLPKRMECHIKEEDLCSEVQEEESEFIDETRNNQCSHLETHSDEADTEHANLQMEALKISSQSVNRICPKIVKIALKRIDDVTDIRKDILTVVPAERDFIDDTRNDQCSHLETPPEVIEREPDDETDILTLVPEEREFIDDTRNDQCSHLETPPEVIEREPDAEADILTVVQEEREFIDDTRKDQCSHLETPPEVIEREPDDEADILTVVPEERDFIDDTRKAQCSHLETPPEVIEREPDDEADILTVVPEERDFIDDTRNDQCSHLETPPEIIEREPDAETGAEHLNLEREESNQNRPAQPSQLVCPKIVKITLKRMDGEDIRKGARVLNTTALKKNTGATTNKRKVVVETNEETQDIIMKQPKIVTNETSVEKPVTASKLLETCDQLHIHSSKVCKDKPKTDTSLKHSVSSVSSRKNKQFSCDTCKKSFGSGSSLKRHIPIHTVKKPYQCHICKSIFKYKWLLDAHDHTYTAEKPFQCHVCQKCFSNKNTLKAHNRLHVDE